ncbi:MAG TPA: hypothetical protein VJR89_28655 [Polyangiales bacterium]|nr:hypothetical protein [Polyangiales bacterium]
MTATSLMLCVLFQSAAVLFVALGIPLRSHLRVTTSHGYQSPSMAREHEAWHAINAAIGRDLIAIGVTLAPLAFLLWLNSTRPDVFALTGAGWLAVGATWILFHVIALMTRYHMR